MNPTGLHTLAAIGRWKQVIGDGLRSRTDERRVTEVNVAVDVLNRMLELGRPNYVRIIGPHKGIGAVAYKLLIHVGVDGPTASGARLGLSLTKTGAVHVRD
jgi:hypothetical protein